MVLVNSLYIFSGINFVIHNIKKQFFNEMFIAFKWLVGLAMVMWVAMCTLDFYLKSRKVHREDILGFNIEPLEIVFKNVTKPNILKREAQLNGPHSVKSKETILIQHCVMFVAGALTVSLFNRKKEIIAYMKNKVVNLNSKQIFAKYEKHFKLTAILISAATVKHLKKILVSLKRYIIKLKIVLYSMNRPERPFDNATDLSILQKIKDINEERMKLAQLLIAAIHENKNIRMRYQLESMAKNRLVHHIEKTQQQVKDNRSRYFNFQQLYLLSNQENMFLKSYIMKLTKEKEDAEKNLMALLREIYQSKNKELKAYCSRFIVKSKENLLNSDVKSEIEKFLQNSYDPAITNKSIYQFCEKSGVEISTTRSRLSGNGHITEIIQKGSLVPFISSAPKLKGLPGECIWTVKDKDGIIEKLYQYNYQSDFDNGDIIRTIREYSVYHDKDCLLDFDSARTKEDLSTDYLIAREKFLTDSSAFKHFMQTNKNIVVTARSRALTLRI